MSLAQRLVALGAVASAPFDAQSLALEGLVRWLRAGRTLSEKHLPPAAAAFAGTPAGRLWLLVEVLRRSPASRTGLSSVVAGMVSGASAVRLFSRAGLPAELRIAAEVVDRMARKVLPDPPDDGDLASSLGRLFREPSAAAWLDAVPPRLLAELFSLIDDDEAGRTIRPRLLEAMADAASLLAVRAAAIGLEDDIRARSGMGGVRASPFLELPRICDQIFDARTGEDVDAAALLRVRLADSVAAARACLARALENLEQGSVSVDLVFRLELAGRVLDRIEVLHRVLDPGPQGGTAAVALFSALAHGVAEERSLAALLRRNSRLLARKIIDRAGETGEHYIASTRREHAHMLASAAGGGLLTAGTAAAKLAIGWLKPAPFFEWALSGMNYAGSFLVMQLAGFTLATKQPSMTAATLAAALADGGRDGRDALVDLIARTARSQLAALVGNIGMVIPAALGVHFASHALAGHAFLDEPTATYVIHSLDLIGSGTLPWAALTGCLLWLSSIVAGWFENWTAYRRLPEAIAGQRALRRLLGPRRTEALARWFRRHASGFGGNVSLGFLLAGTPVLGKLFGAPLDVRHVTLSTGALVLAGAALGPAAVLTPSFALACAGVLCTGALNFGVSFTLALGVALRARDVPLGWLGGLGKALVARFFRRPLSFVLPPPDERPSDSG